MNGFTCRAFAFCSVLPTEHLLKLIHQVFFTFQLTNFTEVSKLKPENAISVDICRSMFRSIEGKLYAVALHIPTVSTLRVQS